VEKKNLRKRILFTVILLALFLPPFVRYQAMSWKNRNLDSQLKALAEENKKLEAEKIRLQTDITYVERKAREKMGLAKKGEIILKDNSPKK